MSVLVERDWITEAGFRAVVLMGSLGHRCGYVGVPANHPLHGVEYSDASPAVQFPRDESIGKRGVIPLLCADPELPASLDVVFDVHGGLTYSGGSESYPVASDGLWWFGYDCGHVGDAPAPGSRMASYGIGMGDVHRDLDYCSAECESLASQLISRVATGAQP